MAGASRRGVVSFFAGWLTGELALHHLAWQAGMTLVFAWAGALRAWPGWIGLAITLLSWCGLACCLVVARRAEAVLEQALALGLGPRYAEEIPTRVGGPLASAIDWRRVLLPFPIRHPEVERVRDIVYARAAGRSCGSTSTATAIIRPPVRRSSRSTAAPGCSAARTSRACPSCTISPRAAGYVSPPTTA